MTNNGDPSLGQALRQAPLARDAARGEAMLADLIAECPEAGCKDRLATLAAGPAVRQLLTGILDCSPYLGGLVRRDAARLVRLLDTPPEARLTALGGELDAAMAGAAAMADAMHHLRVYKTEVALLAALADLGGVWSVMRVTAAITEAADRATAAAVRFLFAQARSRGDWIGDGPAEAVKVSMGFEFSIGLVYRGSCSRPFANCTI